MAVFLHKRKQLIAGLYCFLLLTRFPYARLQTIKRTSTTKQAMFLLIVNDRAMTLAPIQTIEQCDFRCCSLQCLNEDMCESYQRNSMGNVCELLAKDRNTMSDDVAFESRVGWSYYDTGFNVEHPNWRFRRLYKIRCQVDLCDNGCQCFMPPEENRHQCVCLGGVDQIAVNNFCWYAMVGKVVIRDSCDIKYKSYYIRYNSETGDLIFNESGLRICYLNNQLVASNTECPVPTENSRWRLNDEGSFTLRYCIHPATGVLESDGLLLQYSQCFVTNARHKFYEVKPVKGRVYVELWLNVIWNSNNNALSLLNDARYPNNPDYTTWYHAFETVDYYREFDRFGRRMRAYFVSPESGGHTFFVSHDDYVGVYFGSDENSKVQIISVSCCTDLYSASLSSSVQVLQKDVFYYLDVIHLEYLGWDYAYIGVTFPSGRKAFPITEQYLVAIPVPGP